MNAQEVAESVKTMRGRGVELKADFRKVRFDDRSMPLNAPIHHNKILLPSNPSNVNPKKQVVMSKAKDIDLTQKIKNAASVRADEALDVLQYEPMNVPPCLSTSTGEIYSGTKSTVLKPLRKLGAVAQFPLFSEVMSTLIIDLSFVVNLLGSVRAVTYGATVNRFLDTVWTYIEQLGTRYARIDIVTDRYNCVHLLKQRTRAHRGVGTITNLSGESELPSNFCEDYLRNDVNKDNFYKLLVEDFVRRSAILSEKVIVLTKDTETICNTNLNEFMEPTNHIEADYRIVRHVLDAIERGHFIVAVRCTDSDIIIILLSYMHQFLALNQDVKVHCLMGSNKTYVNICLNKIVDSIGIVKCRGLLFWHSFTGSDYTSAFVKKGKCTWWNHYLESDIVELYQVFTDLSTCPSEVTDHQLMVIQQFVATVYKARGQNLQEMRLDLLIHGDVKTFTQLPPSVGSLIEHVRRSALVAGHLWGTAHCVEADLPPLEEWGFKIEDARLVPHWTDTSKENELIYKKLFNKCRCTKSKCKKLCACFKLHLECLEACKCRRSCIES